MSSFKNYCPFPPPPPPPARSLDQHHYTVATEQGVQDAQALGFRLLNATLGYVYTSKPGSFYGSTGTPPLARWDYSMALLMSAKP